jgi:hypothetical protein
VAGPWEKYRQPASSGDRPVYQELPPVPAPQTVPQRRKDEIDVTRAQQDAGITAATRGPVIAKANEEARIARLNREKLERESRPPKLPPSQLKSVRADAIAKINQVRTIRRKLGDGGIRQGDFLPETGILGVALSKTGYGNAAEIAARIKTLESGAALTTIKKWIAETGKNPLTPMSEADTKLLSQDTGNLSLNQPEESFRSALDAFENAYANAYLGAGGRPDVLERGKKKQKPRVIDFNSLPE